MKKKIVHIITRFINGGAEENTLITCNYSAKKGDKVYLVTGKEIDKEIISKLNSKIKVIKINNLIREIDFIKDLKAMYKIFKFLKFINPDIVHTHESKAGAIGRLAAFFSKTKIIIHTVHILPFLNVNFLKKVFYIFIERSLSKITNKYICVSQGMLKESLKYNVGFKKQYQIVHSGFNIKKFKNAIKNLKILKKNNINRKAKIILMLGAFEERKRHVQLIKVFLRLTKIHNNIVLLLVGSGKLFHKIKKNVNELRLSKKILFTGFKNDPENYIALSDICLMYSIREGLPRVVPQYISGGKPVITSDLPGINEIIKNNVNGYIVDMFKPNELYSKLNLLLLDSKILKKLSLGAKKTNTSKWSIDQMPIKIDQIYCKLLK
ncbi:glycosyltransferase [Candidatus Pelagibacter sp.]|jgi:glycosyltransferase involved in cell wall biosynthesis|nr:glycosyltransferase [Candidatus Pelagibacter sp.]